MDSRSALGGSPQLGQATDCVKANRPKQIDKDHKIHDLQPLAECPHTAGRVLESNDLLLGNARRSGLVHDHELALPGNGFVCDVPDDHEDAELKHYTLIDSQPADKSLVRILEHRALVAEHCQDN